MNKQIDYIDNLNKQFIKFLLSQTKEEYITIGNFLIHLTNFAILQNGFPLEYFRLIKSIYIPYNFYDKIYIGDLITC